MKNFVFVLFAFALISCSTMDGVRYLAEAAKPKAAEPAQPAQPAQPASDQKASAPKSASTSGLDTSAKADWARYSNPAASGKSFGPGADLSAASGSALGTLKAGEWAVYRTVENGQTKEILKMAVVSQQADTWVYEFVSVSDKDSAVVQEAVKGLDAVVQTGDADKGQVLWIKVKDKEGKVQTLEGAMLGVAGAGYKNMLTANAAHFSGTVVAGGPVTVPAGTFSSTWKADSKSAQGRGSGTAWVSTVVPLWHLIKGVGQSGHVLELVDFGTSGYQSALP